MQYRKINLIYSRGVYIYVFLSSTLGPWAVSNSEQLHHTHSTQTHSTITYSVSLFIILFYNEVVAGHLELDIKQDNVRACSTSQEFAQRHSCNSSSGFITIYQIHLNACNKNPFRKKLPGCHTFLKCEQDMTSLYMHCKAHNVEKIIH